ncbi:MAG TPA: DUF2007 domain-containing protein [Terracidiphilus sp.]|jgi:hypothetical protein|nr:DUF2007 domain-containing protein [Terracidiphilus sp.]
MPDPNLKLATVFESDDPVAFNLAKSVLEDAGIEFAVTVAALTGYGFSPIVNPVSKIEVAETSAERAIELIQGTQQAADSGERENDQPTE